MNTENFKDTVKLLKIRFDLIENNGSTNVEMFKEIEKVAEHTLKNIMLLIRNAESYELFQECCVVLGDLQLMTAKLLFKHKVDISGYLEKFTRDFDLIDDPRRRFHLFNEIISGFTPNFVPRYKA